MAIEEGGIFASLVPLVVERGVVVGAHDVHFNDLPVDVRFEGVILDEDVVIVHGVSAIAEFGYGNHLILVVNKETTDNQFLQTEIGLVEVANALFYRLEGQFSGFHQQNGIVIVVGRVGEDASFFGFFGLH